jgi:GNAT superfamily N-acetyltransferase
VVTVRAATPADADAIGRIQVETWRAAYAGLMPDEAIASFDVEARQAMWREGLARVPRPGSATFVAEAGGRPVGFATAGAARDEPDGTGELYAIYVDSASWSTGAGRALIEQVEASLRDSGFREAMLWVLEGNERAERFYRLAGWSHDGGRKVEEFQGAVVTEVRYRKPL